jgi:hypothetical protein
MIGLNGQNLTIIRFGFGQPSRLMVAKSNSEHAGDRSMDWPVAGSGNGAALTTIHDGEPLCQRCGGIQSTSGALMLRASIGREQRYQARFYRNVLDRTKKGPRRHCTNHAMDKREGKVTASGDDLSVIQVATRMVSRWYRSQS